RGQASRGSTGQGQAEGPSRCCSAGGDRRADGIPPPASPIVERHPPPPRPGALFSPTSTDRPPPNDPPARGLGHGFPARRRGARGTARPRGRRHTAASLARIRYVAVALGGGEVGFQRGDPEGCHPDDERLPLDVLEVKHTVARRVERQVPHLGPVYLLECG